jgi:hypothetical protein
MSFDSMARAYARTDGAMSAVVGGVGAGAVVVGGCAVLGDSTCCVCTGRGTTATGGGDVTACCCAREFWVGGGTIGCAATVDGCCTVLVVTLGGALFGGSAARAAARESSVGLCGAPRKGSAVFALRELAVVGGRGGGAGAMVVAFPFAAEMGALAFSVGVTDGFVATAAN